MQSRALEQLQSKLTDCHFTSANRKAALEEQTARLEKEGTILRDAEKTISELQLTYEAREKDVHQLEGELAAKNLELVTANDAIQSDQHSMKQILSQKVILEGELSAATKELDGIAAKHHAIQLSLAAVNDVNYALENDLNNAKNIRDNLERDCCSLRAENAKLTHDKAAVEKDLTAIFEQTRQINHEKVFLRSQLDLRRQTNDELDGKLKLTISDHTRSLNKLINSPFFTAGVNTFSVNADLFILN